MGIWGKIAAARAELAPRFAKHHMEELVQKEVKYIEPTPGELAGHKGFVTGIYSEDIVLGRRDKIKRDLLAELAAWAKAANLQPPTDIEGLDAACEKYYAEVARLAPTLRNEYPVQDAQITKVARAAWSKAHPNWQILSVHVKSSTWIVEKNVFGIPIFRLKRGGIRYKRPDCKLVVWEDFRYTENSSGGGKWRVNPPVGDAIRYMSK